MFLSYCCCLYSEGWVIVIGGECGWLRMKDGGLGVVDIIFIITVRL